MTGICASPDDAGRRRVSGALFVQSAFNGAGHFVDVNANQISNEDGPEVWWMPAGR